MIALYDNKVFDSTITAFTENSGYLFSEGLKDTRLTKKGRTIDAANQWVKHDMQEVISASKFTILNHNFSGAAVVNLEANTIDDFTTPAFTHSVTIQENIYELFSVQDYRYWRITVDDPTNPDGFIEFGYDFIGVETLFPGMDLGAELPVDDTSVVDTSPTGERYADKRIFLEQNTFNFAGMSQANNNEITLMYKTVGKFRPFISIRYEENLVEFPMFYCAFNMPLSWQKVAGPGLLYNLNIQLIEAK